jgi:hypothetical protein
MIYLVKKNANDLFCLGNFFGAFEFEGVPVLAMDVRVRFGLRKKMNLSISDQFKCRPILSS